MKSETRFGGVLGFGQGPFVSSTGVLKIRKEGTLVPFGVFWPENEVASFGKRKSKLATFR